MTDFTIESVYVDEDGIEQVEVDTYSGILTDGVFSVSVLDPETNEQIVICDQPWNPRGDGSREPWVDEAEAIAWFKSTRITE